VDQRTNAQVIEAVYQAFSTGDLAAFDAYTDDSVWDEAGRNQRTGVYRGKEAILEHAMQLAVLTDGTIATTVKEILPGRIMSLPLCVPRPSETAECWIWIAAPSTHSGTARSPNCTCCHLTQTAGTNSGRRTGCRFRVFQT
jgi:hypothetical protein